MKTPFDFQRFSGALLDAVADGITAQDRTGRLIYANHMAAELIGFPSTDTLLATSLSDVTQNFEVFDELGQLLPFSELPGRFALKGLEVPERILRFRILSTGEERWARVKAKPVFDEQGEVAFAVNTFHDITPLKRIQLTLEESETRFRIMADYAPVMIWLTGDNSLRIYVNRPWLDFTGRTIEQTLGYGWAEDVHPDDYERCLEIYNQAFDAREEFTIEYRLRRNDGEYRWVLDKGVPRYEGDRRFVGYIGTCLDITHRKQQELNKDFLDNASRILASSLDYETTLNNVAKLATEQVADWCVVDILNPEGAIERLAVAHKDVTKIARVKELQRRFPIDPSSQRGVAHVLRSGQPEYYAEISDELLAASTADPERLALLRQFGFRSAIIVPLAAKGTTFGTITLVNTSDSERRFAPEDFALAEELGRRASVAIENARLYRDIALERQRFAVTLSSIGDAVIATNASGDITFMNAAAEQLTEWTLDDAYGRALDQVFHIVNATTRAVVESPVSKVLRSGAVVGLGKHTLLISKHGREKPIEDSVAPMRDDGGTLVGVVLVFRDVTDAKQAEEARELLANATELFAKQHLQMADVLESVTRFVAEHIGDACTIRLLSDDGQWLNAVAFHHPDSSTRNIMQQILAQAPVRVDEGVVGRVVKRNEAILIPELSVEQMRTVLQPEFRPFLEKVGVCSVLEVPLRIQGRVIGTLGITRDKPARRYTMHDQVLVQNVADHAAVAIENARLYTEAQIARERAEVADRLKAQFLATISHELRTPLTSIKGFSSTLLAQDVSFEASSQREFLHIIDDEATKLAQLVDQLLDISQLQVGALPVKPMPQDLHTVLEAVQPQLKTLTQQHRFVVIWPENLPTVHIDAQRIQQVLVNLIDNAVKFSPLASIVTLRAFVDGDKVRIDVTDQGMGIPIEECQIVFEAFRQKRRDSRQRGAGLGLAICKRLIEAHGGEIWIDSTGDTGTVVSFSLPIDGPPKGQTVH